ncbi:MAG: DegT/DnrJ/EryC1/StrS family aminotransferase [Terriglobales bacterium]
MTSSSTAKLPASKPPTAASSPSIEAVPLLDLHRQYKEIKDEILAAIERVCASQQFVLGAEVETLEREIAAYTSVTAAVGCASGTDALWLALAAAGVGPGDFVITTAFSFFASASAIARAGAKPVLLDVDPETLNLDATLVRAKLQRGGSYKVRAILPVHLYGQCADMNALQTIANEFNLPIIEDAAQAIGAKWDGKPAGSLGVAAAFSFYPTKNLSAYGDAGLVTTSDPDVAEHMRRLRNHGSPQRYYHDEFGWNARMDGIQAAVLRVKMRHIDSWNESRRQIASNYDRLLQEAGLMSAKLGTPIRSLTVSSHAHHVFHQYVVRADRRDELRKFLADRKIGTEVYYPVPLHLQECFIYLGYREGDLPESELAAREVLALPMFPELTEDEQRRVVESISDFYS